MLAISPSEVVEPGLFRAAANRLGDLGPRRSGHHRLVHAARVAVVAGEQLAEREDLQALVGGQRLVLGGLGMATGIELAARLELRHRASDQVPRGQFLYAFAHINEAGTRPGRVVAPLRLIECPDRLLGWWSATVGAV